MINEEILAFIKKSKTEGHTSGEIQEVLVKNGWTPEDVSEGFRALEQGSLRADSSIQSAIVSPKKSKKKILLSVIILLVFILGFSAYLAKDKLKNLPILENFFSAGKIASPIPEDIDSILPEDAETSVSTATPADNTKEDETGQSAILPSVANKEKKCDNFDCLISAASKCEPISALISLKNIPSPLLGQINTSLETEYKIESSKVLGKCIISFYVLSESFSVAGTGKVEMFGKVLTESQIDEVLKEMNESTKNISEFITTCEDAPPADIAAYLTDVKNGTANADSSANIESGKSTTVFTTTTGKKLTCTAQRK